MFELIAIGILVVGQVIMKAIDRKDAKKRTRAELLFKEWAPLAFDTVEGLVKSGKLDGKLDTRSKIQAFMEEVQEQAGKLTDAERQKLETWARQKATAAKKNLIPNLAPKTGGK